MSYRIVTGYHPAQHGGIDGYTLECTCGLTWTTSMESNVRLEANEHLAWHEKASR